MQFGGGSLCHSLDQVIAELSTNDRTNLPDLLGGLPQPVEPCNQRGLQRGRDCELRERMCRQHRSDTIAAIATFEDGFGQLFDKQWHPVGTGHDFIDGLGRQAGTPGELIDQRSAVMPAESVERQRRYVRLAIPGVLIFGSEGDQRAELASARRDRISDRAAHARWGPPNGRPRKP